jgi:hypothetical protein
MALFGEPERTLQLLDGKAAMRVAAERLGRRVELKLAGYGSGCNLFGGHSSLLRRRADAVRPRRKVEAALLADPVERGNATTRLALAG